jgi:hypothetical protein
MKKSILVLLAVLSAGSLFAQAQSTDSLLLGILGAFASAPALTAYILVLTEWLKAAFKANGTWAHVISIGVGIILGSVGMIFDIGVFAESTQLQDLTVLVGSIAAANGLFTYSSVKKFLDFITPALHKVFKKKA